ncbi:hypothetical protein GII23_05560 [Stutzerimonas balearica]|jgi:hypothetical protein|uniref:hypothetical protein n=1 Tax=Stutzerimonas balearica TaxID=74829 RepID=UPI0013F44A0D|nr:hypothetical protein [Stutzerimonas balearica]MBC7199859.1 hypothetical protein [Stutzerimonas balearica]MCZ4129078.1 hypothetical protein [Stutzerimonas balearica]QII99589.1 hypothetical protein GII23_05560 [Stutzerimonas balearica]WIX02398.1 hypothetical protein QK899_18135 [Pseudomonas sp. AR5]
MSALPQVLAAAALALTAGASTLAVGCLRRQAGEAERPALFCALLGLGLATALGACRLASSIGIATGAAQVWFEQATLQLGVPLIALACLASARGWHWSGPTWGRLLLGLCAFFELARQFGASEPYALGLSLLSALLVTYAGLVRWPDRHAALAGALGGLLLLAAAWAGPHGDVAATFALALAAPLLALLLRRLGRSAEPLANG